ncbi:MAG: amino acid ABC transporter substrate-binding protein [Planctomycetes bacterium]|nr:amino acid ABC transporter substrate-binding protein [Planctomycetota bacterium]
MRSVIQASRVSAVAIAGLLVAGTNPAQAADDLMAKIKKNGVVRLCTTDSPPVAAKDPKTNEWQGTYIDMANKFAATLNVKVEWVDSTWGTLVQYVTTGKCDISAAQTYITAVRAQQVLFTRPITSNSQAIFVAADSPYKTIEDLDVAGKVVAVIAGSTNEKWGKETFTKATIKPIVTDRQSTPLFEVASKRADATMMAVIATMEVLDQNKNLAHQENEWVI